MDSPDVVYFKDDFTVFIRMKDIFGEIEDSTDFDVRFFTDRSTSVYTASCKQGVCKNCIREEDGFRFIFDSHILSTGTLRYETHFFIPDTIFPDGIRDVYKKGMLNIQLTKDDVGCPDPLQAEMLLPFIKGKDGKSLTYDDLTEEQKRDIMSYFDNGSTGSAGNAWIDGGSVSQDLLDQILSGSDTVFSLPAENLSSVLDDINKSGNAKMYVGLTYCVHDDDNKPTSQVLFLPFASFSELNCVTFADFSHYNINIGESVSYNVVFNDGQIVLTKKNIQSKPWLDVSPEVNPEFDIEALVHNAMTSDFGEASCALQGIDAYLDPSEFYGLRILDSYGSELYSLPFFKNENGFDFVCLPVIIQGLDGYSLLSVRFRGGQEYGDTPCVIVNDITHNISGVDKQPLTFYLNAGSGAEFGLQAGTLHSLDIPDDVKKGLVTAFDMLEDCRKTSMLSSIKSKVATDSPFSNLPRFLLTFSSGASPVFRFECQGTERVEFNGFYFKGNVFIDGDFSEHLALWNYGTNVISFKRLTK